MLCAMMCCGGPVTLPASPLVKSITTTRPQSTPAGQATVSKAVIINSTKGDPARSRACSVLFSNFITILPKAPEPTSGQSCVNPHLSALHTSVAVSHCPPLASPCLLKGLMSKEVTATEMEAMNWAQEYRFSLTQTEKLVWLLPLLSV